jgi:hypothetical protein
MRLLTHFLSVALVGICQSGAAQSLFTPELQRLVVTAAGPQLIRLEEPVNAGLGKVMVQWSVAFAGQPGYITIERSSLSGGPYEVLAVQRQESGKGKFTDEQPLRGTNYYRVKWSPDNGWQQVSRTAAMKFAGDMTCRFYPNPVDNILIVRSEQALDLLLTDASGQVRTNVKLKSGLQTVDVSGLEKGMYIITLTQLESGLVLTEKLLKN